MIQKKICMLGAFSVGKTSLVRRYVSSVFSDAYLTTVGVKIDKRVIDLDGREVTLILWDIAGEDDVSTVRMSYLRGSAGFVLVADGTRARTLDVAKSLQSRVQAELGEVPFTMLVNKSDLADQWTIADAELDALRALARRERPRIEQPLGHSTVKPASRRILGGSRVRWQPPARGVHTGSMRCCQRCARTERAVPCSANSSSPPRRSSRPRRRPTA
mgnify:CR=1 FL=1